MKLRLRINKLRAILIKELIDDLFFFTESKESMSIHVFLHAYYLYREFLFYLGFKYESIDSLIEAFGLEVL